MPGNDHNPGEGITGNDRVIPKLIVPTVTPKELLRMMNEADDETTRIRADAMPLIDPTTLEDFPLRAEVERWCAKCGSRSTWLCIVVIGAAGTFVPSAQYGEAACAEHAGEFIAWLHDKGEWAPAIPHG